MSPFYCFQYLVYCFFIQLFTVFTYLVYYGDVLSSNFWLELQSEYDYIVVGSGTGGSVIAHRIATETNYTFVVLEAGSRNHALLEIPIVGPAMHRSLFDWCYETVPQEYACHAMVENKCRLPQGKIIGGSSKFNNMIHFRGNISHYVQWFHGKHTQEYITKHFKFVEDNMLHLNELQYESELTSAIIEAAKELGYKELDGEFALGFMRSQLSQKNGKRWSISDNLDMSKHVVTNVVVEKVVFKDNAAQAVEVLHVDKKLKLYARKGVILSAGVYNTPKILQLSGIGPSELLEPLGIPVVKNLPVGMNLQDHISTGLDLIIFNESLSIGASDILNPMNSYNYFLNGKGPLTTPGSEVIGFLSTKNVAAPDVQFMVLPVGIASDRGSRLRKSLGVKDEIWHNYFVKGFDKHTASILPVVLHPESKGRVFINSKDSKRPPMIDPKYLSNKKDRDTLIGGLKFVLKFVKTNSMRRIGAAINPTQFSGCEGYTMFSEQYWECYIKHLSLTSYHSVGTCSMGLYDSEQSVVDTSFRVIGIKRLYVADASVLPTLPSGNINAAIAMMANIFFDTNIKVDRDIKIKEASVCYKDDLLNNFLYNICIVSVKT